MSKNNIPIVVVHRGYKPYVKYSVNLSSKKNFVYVIGSKDLKFLEENNLNVRYVNIDDFALKKEIIEFKNQFINYSTYEDNFAWYCFERIFIIEEFLNEKKIPKVFHIDSDNAVFVDINSINFKKDTAYHISQFQDNLNMNASVHSGLLDIKFCNEYNKLFQDIYINKSKFELIEQKYQYHLQNNLKGGVIDMTLYYLLYNLNLVDVQNLMKPIEDKTGFNNIFINNINLPEGFQSLNNFEMKKKLIKIYNKKYVKDIINDELLILASMHFQGTAKKYLNYLSQFKFH